MTLAGQFLALQLTIIVLVLLAVTGVSLAQADAAFRHTEGQRMRAIAETGASMETVRVGLGDVSRQGILQPTAEGLRSLSGADQIIVTRPDLRILAAPDPGVAEAPLDVGGSRVLEGRAWTGITESAGRSYLTALVPVIGNEGEVIGIVAAGRRHPGIGQRMAAAAPNLLVYLGIAGSLGVVGSLLLARRVKRQTLGLEPVEITRLVEHRGAMLHGIKEGVIGLDPDNRITLVNDKAVELLALPADSAGLTLAELEVEPGLHDALTGAVGGRDQVVAMGGRLVTLNRMPLVDDGRPAGSVTTMRDRTDLLALRHELDATRTTTDALRAQAHEFSNQLHVITGLLELGEYDELSQYVRRVGGARATLSDDVTSRIADPSVAALLVAKASLAGEQNARLHLAGTAILGPVEEDLSVDLVTVVGNLVDNALESLRTIADRADRVGLVEVGLVEDEENVLVNVRDTGPGVPAPLREKIFEHGFSTKDAASERGLGLAITQLVCARRGGTVHMVHAGRDATDPEDWGAEFVARLPRRDTRAGQAGLS